MLTLFQELWRRSNHFKRYLDAYGLDQATKLNCLEDALKRQLPLGQATLVIAHFPETFFRLQQFFDERSIEYQVGVRSVSHEQIRLHAERHANEVLLVLAETLKTSTSNPSTDLQQRLEIAAIAVERYPRPQNDLAIEDFCRSLPYRSRLGYFLAMDDPTVRNAVGDNLIELMKQLGMKPATMISSEMMNSRINRSLNRRYADLRNEVLSDSAADWLLQNKPIETTPEA
jgi:hypothetical protein